MDSAAIQIRKQGIVAVAVMVAVVQGILVIAFPVELLLYVIAFTLSAGVLIFCLVKPEGLVYYVLFAGSLVGIGREFSTVQVFGARVSFWGFLWSLTLMAVLLVLFLNLRKVKLPGYLIPFFIFAAWVAMRWVAGTATVMGFADIVFFVLPPLMGIYLAMLFSRGQPKLEETLLRFFVLTGFLPPLFYLVLWLLGMLEMTQWGPQGPVHARTTALYVLVVMCAGVPLWRYARTRGEKVLGITLMLLGPAMALFTLGRTTFFLTVAILVFSRVDPSRHLRLVAAGAAAVSLAIALTITVPGLRERTFHRPPKNMQEAFLYLNTSGRSARWPLTFDHAVQKPLLGWGPAEARRLLGADAERDSELRHPHNEYLQVFHDFGVVGLGLFLFAWISLLVRNWRRWQHADRIADQRLSLWSMATVLGVLAMFGYGIIGNNFHYVWVLSPIFMFAACSEHVAWTRRSAGAAVRGQPLITGEA